MFSILILYTICALIREKIVFYQSDKAADQKIAQWRAAHPDEKFIHF